MSFMTQLNHLVSVSRNERGETLPGALIAAIVGGIVLLGASSAILSTLGGSSTITDNGSLITTATALDGSLRNDVSNATIISPQTNTSVKFTVPGKKGTCRTTSWANGTAADGSTTVTKTVVNYTSQTLNADGIAVCSGTAGTPITEALATNVTSVAYTYANRVGRGIVASSDSNGNITTAWTDSTATAPSGVPASQWSDMTITRVTLTISSKSAGGVVASRTITQFSSLADNTDTYSNPITNNPGTQVTGTTTTVTGPTPKLALASAPTVAVAAVNLRDSVVAFWTANSCPTGTTLTSYQLFETSAPNTIIYAGTATTSSAFTVPATPIKPIFQVNQNCTKTSTSAVYNAKGTATSAITVSVDAPTTAVTISSPAASATGVSRTVKVSWGSAANTGSAPTATQCDIGTTPRYVLTQTKKNGTAQTAVTLTTLNSTTATPSFTFASGALGTGVQTLVLTTSCIDNASPAHPSDTGIAAAARSFTTV